MYVCVCVSTAVAAAARGGQRRRSAVSGSARVAVGATVLLLLGGSRGRGVGAVRGAVRRHFGAWAAGTRATHALRILLSATHRPAQSAGVTTRLPSQTAFDRQAVGRRTALAEIAQSFGPPSLCTTGTPSLRSPGTQPLHESCRWMRGWRWEAARSSRRIRLVACGTHPHPFDRCFVV